MGKRVMFYCQHLLGMGHLVRSTEIVRALARDGFSVLFVTGGEVPKDFRMPRGIETFELIPLKSTPDFSSLLLCDPSWDMEETKAIRRELLLHEFDKFQPDILVTELFPFGRKQFSFELLPLLRRARSSSANPLIVSSVRDILVNRNDQDKFEDRVCGIVNEFYDLVLVHGDPQFQTLKGTFSRADDLQCPVEYTGYVVQELKTTAADGDAFALEQIHKPMIVVSNGSGKCPSGHQLLESVLRAASLLEKQIPHQFQVFAGPLIPDPAYEDLQKIASQAGNVTLSRYTPNLPGYMRRAELSISMAGYNTVMDILSAGVRSLVYPVTGNSEDEQLTRAKKLAAMGVLGLLDENQLHPQTLARKIQHALSSKPPRIPFNCGGGPNSSLLLRKYLDMREQCPPALNLPCSPAVNAAGGIF